MDSPNGSQISAVKGMFSHARSGCWVETGGLWYSRCTIVDMSTHRQLDGRAPWPDLPCLWSLVIAEVGLECVDMENWVLDPFLVEWIFLLLHPCSTRNDLCWSQFSARSVSVLRMYERTLRAMKGDCEIVWNVSSCWNIPRFPGELPAGTIECRLLHVPSLVA